MSLVRIIRRLPGLLLGDWGICMHRPTYSIWLREVPAKCSAGSQLGIWEIARAIVLNGPGVPRALQVSLLAMP